MNAIPQIVDQEVSAATDPKWTLQQPIIPIDYVEMQFAGEAASCFAQWMMDKLTEPCATELYHAILFFALYQVEYYKNGGQVPAELNSMVPDYLIGGLRAMELLGYEF